MNLIYVVLGVLIGLHTGYRTVCIIMLSTDESYNNKTRVLMNLCGFVAIFALTTWLSVTALTVMFGI